MNEAEILELTAIARSNLIGAIQWWASVTFGLIAIAHFGRTTLNLALVTIIICIYVAFTGWVGIIVITQIWELNDLRADLSSLVSDTYQLSQTGLSAAELPPAARFAMVLLSIISISGAFFSSIGYLIWTYRRRANT